IVGRIDAVDQGKIVERIKEMDRLIERLEGRYGILTHHWDIAIGNLGRNHVDEGLAGDDAFIAPAPGRTVQDREQVWDLAVDLARPDDTVIVERLVDPTSHRQAYPGRHGYGQGQAWEEIEPLHWRIVANVRRAEARIRGIQTKPQAAWQSGRKLTEVHAWQGTELLGRAVRWEPSIQRALHGHTTVVEQFGQGPIRGGTDGRFL